MSEPNTRERLLNAAEALIADQGYNCTSLRQITQRAEANVAAVNYHFKSKHGLVKAMMERRLDPLDRIRLSRLAEIQQKAALEGCKPDLVEVLRGFIEPTLFYLTQNEGGRNFIRIICRVHTEPGGVIKQIFFKTIRPVAVRFFNTLCAALPDLPPQVIFFRMIFCIGAMSNTANLMAENGIIAELQETFQIDLDVSLDENTLMNELLAFVTSGMEATCVS